MCGISGIINFNKKPNKIVAQNINNAICTEVQIFKVVGPIISVHIISLDFLL